jgi:hypothetical protein
MFEEREKNGIAYVLQVLAGFLIGLITSTIAMAIVTIFVMGMLGRLGGRAWPWIGEIVDIGAFAVVGYFIFRSMDRSAMSRGILIGMSIAFLLNAICGVGMLMSR